MKPITPSRGFAAESGPVDRDDRAQAAACAATWTEKRKAIEARHAPLNDGTCSHDYKSRSHADSWYAIKWTGIIVLVACALLAVAQACGLIGCAS